MKKFLFTLAALFMVSTASAEDYLYIEDFEVTPEFLAQTSGKAREMTLDVKAHFDLFVSAFQVWINTPEGITNRDALAGAAMTQSGYTRTGNTIERSVALSVSEGVDIFIAAWQENDWYYPEGLDPDEDDPVAVGSVKWAPGDYAQMFTLTVRFAQDFTGGEIMVISEPACAGTDPRGECCPKDEHVEKACQVTIAGAQTPDPAPVPTITMSDTYEVSAVCQDHEVVLMINGEPVQNPYQITQTYEPQTITFTAYTVANADESGNSDPVTYVAEVPALEKDYAPAPTFSEAEGKVYATAPEGYTVVMMLEGVVCDNPYTLPAANYENDQVLNFTAYTVKKTEYYDSEVVSYTATVNKLEKQDLEGTIQISEPDENGVITVVYTGSENVTLTVTINGEEVEAPYQLNNGENEVVATVSAVGYNSLTATADLVYNAPVVPVETTTYVKVTSNDQLVAGKHYILVAGEYAMGAVTNNAAAPGVAITINGEEAEATADVTVLTLGEPLTQFGATYWPVQLANGQYLACGGNNKFKLLADASSSYYMWKISSTFSMMDGDYNYSIKKSRINDFAPTNSTTDMTYATLYVEKTGEVPPTPEPAPVPTITMSDTYEVSAVCEDHEVVLMIGDEVVANPYQITQTYEAQTITFTAYTVANADESGNSDPVTYVANVPAMQQPYAAEPIITFNEDANGVTVNIENYTEYTITVDGVLVASRDGNNVYYVQKVYDKAQVVEVYAKNNPGAPYIATEDTETYNLPAKEKAQNSKPTVAYSYENGQLNVWAEGCTEENVTYTLYCDGVEYTGTFPIAVVAADGYNHTWTATAVSPTTTVSEVSDPCAIVIAPVTPELETCVAPNGDYVIIDKEKALVTITNNEEGATVHYVVTLNGVVVAEGDFTGDTWEYVAEGVGDWVVSCVASLPGKNDSQPGGVFFPIAENQWPTAIDEMMAGKTISNVRYFNVAGQEMQEANGTTIVVTTYTDGTKSAVKVMK